MCQPTIPTSRPSLSQTAPLELKHTGTLRVARTTSPVVPPLPPIQDPIANHQHRACMGDTTATATTTSTSDLQKADNLSICSINFWFATPDFPPCLQKNADPENKKKCQPTFAIGYPMCPTRLDQKLLPHKVICRSADRSSAGVRAARIVLFVFAGIGCAGVVQERHVFNVHDDIFGAGQTAPGSVIRPEINPGRGVSVFRYMR
jgi:hypothetical protein